MRNLIFLISFVFIISCNQNNNNEFENIIDKKNLVKFLNARKLHLDSFKKVVIIPNAGCDGCISDAEKRFVNSYKSIDTLYIFTRIADLKIFKNSLPKEALMHKNVLIDTNSNLNSYGFYSMYPSIIEDISENNLKATPYLK